MIGERVRALPIHVSRRLETLESNLRHSITARQARRAIRDETSQDTYWGMRDVSAAINNPSTIVEVGAHIGVDTQRLATAFPQCRIYAFEASLDLACKARARLRHYPNVTVIPSAVSDAFGVSKFYVSSGLSDASSSLLKPTSHLRIHPEVYFRESHETLVPVVTLDDYFRMTSVTCVDLLWMDVQGAESRVLRGADEVLTMTHRIYLEVSEKALYEGGATFDEIDELLTTRGFTSERIFLPGSGARVGNALYIRS